MYNIIRIIGDALSGAILLNAVFIITRTLFYYDTMKLLVIIYNLVQIFCSKKRGFEMSRKSVAGKLVLGRQVLLL
jgi:hypothetical protein